MAVPVIISPVRLLNLCCQLHIIAGQWLYNDNEIQWLQNLRKSSVNFISVNTMKGFIFKSRKNKENENRIELS